MVRGLADIGAEGILLAGAGRAILLQIADPRVGHGVADHSDFAQRPDNVAAPRAGRERNEIRRNATGARVGGQDRIAREVWNRVTAGIRGANRDGDGFTGRNR